MANLAELEPNDCLFFPVLILCWTLFISGKFTLLVQGASPDLEVEQERMLSNREGPQDNAGVTRFVIQRLPKDTVTLYNSKTVSVPTGPDIQHSCDNKNELLKTRTGVEPGTKITSGHHYNQNIDFTAMNLLASASTFQQGNF